MYKIKHSNYSINKLVFIFIITFSLFSNMKVSYANTLYEDFGGDQGMSSVVDQFLWNLADDKRINHHFIESNIKRFRAKLIEMFCDVSDGPCKYNGDDMVRVHRGMNLKDAEFNAVVENLIEAMEKEGIKTGAQNRLLKILATYYTDIVKRSKI